MKLFEWMERSRSPLAEADATLLSTLRCGWRVLVGRDRRPIGVRLTLTPAPDTEADEGATLAAQLDAVLSALTSENDGQQALLQGLIDLVPCGLALDGSMTQWRAPRNVLLELAQDDLAHESGLRHVFEIQRHGVRIALRLDGSATPSAERLQYFQTLVVPGHGDLPAAVDARLASVWTLNCASHDDVRGAFDAGVHAVCGWPMVADRRSQPAGLTPAQNAVFELIRLIQADAEVRHLESVFKAEPLLAYLLLTLANSPAFRRSMPVSSIGHAISLLGYQRLTRWLVLLLAIAGKEPHAAPLVFTAVARGHFLEHLAAAAGRTRAERDDVFVLGMFSLLDAITGQSLQDLLQGIPLSAPLVDALVGSAGPYASLLALARSREGDLQAPTETPHAWPLDEALVNRALLKGLAAADALQYLIR